MALQTASIAYLYLADGTLMEGISIGAIGTSGGEICFNTGMTGYQEIYTDPSYLGQIVVNTTAHIGNYGAFGEPESESGGAKIAGLVVNEFAKIHSRFSAESSLQTWLEKQNLIGIARIDTRALVRHIRKQGAMNAIISTESGDVDFLKEKLAKVPDMAHLELSSLVSTNQPYTFGPENRKKIAVLDFGVKQNILRSLAAQGLSLKVFNGKSSLEEMEEFRPDGYFLSNGPGDPSAMPYAVHTIKEILSTQKPLFGICMGHQLLAQAIGISTYKMHHGHRGLNHPVLNLETMRSEITSQNHGFAVSTEELKNHKEAVITHINLNDDTVEGLRLKNQPAFSVQYHPEAAPGPHDSHYLFQDFAKLVAQN